MISSATPLNQLAGTADLARRFGLIVAGLAAVIARRFLQKPALVGLIVPLWGWLSRAARRFERLVARPVRARSGRGGGGGSVGSRWPSRRGWLVRELGYEAGAYGSQLAHLLAEPDMQALLEAVPGVGRILRPLCRMLAIDVPALAKAPEVIAEIAARRNGKRRAARAALVVAWPRKGLPQLPTQAWFERPGKNRGSCG